MLIKRLGGSWNSCEKIDILSRRNMLTKINKFSNIILAIGVAAFLFPIQAMSRTGKSLTASSDSRPKVAFFIGEDMRTCEIENCKDKYYANGLCNKHYQRKHRIDSYKYKQWCKNRYKNNKEKRNEQARKYYQDNKEHIAKRDKQYQQKNKEKISERKKKYYQDNREYVLERNKQWKKTIAGKLSIKIDHHNRRTMTRCLTKEIVQRVYEDNIKKYGTLTCILCFKPIINGDDSLEHSTPLTRKGNNDYANLGIAHKSCNSQKHTQTLEEWFKK